MSKKHFEAMAKLVAGLKGQMPEAARILFVRELAHLCGQTNARFNWSRFIAACGVER
jgi:hypothetical protein